MGWEREAAWSPSCDLFVNGSFKGNHTDSEQDIKIELMSMCFSWLWFGNTTFSSQFMYNTCCFIVLVNPIVLTFKIILRYS